MSSTHWRPLIEGELIPRAEDAVRAIADALAPRSLGADGDWSARLPVSVTTAQALFYGYLARSAQADAGLYAERADQLLERSFELVASTPMPPILHGGFTGVAWTAEHFTRVLGDATQEPGADDANEEVDECLLTMLAAPYTGHYDLISGLAGFGVYALERADRPVARRCLEAIVDRLHETAEVRGDVVTWFTPPELLPPRHREQHPRGHYNLGVAHGVPAVIGLLADVCRLEIRAERARPLLEGAVHWVLSQRLSDRRGARYPASIAPEMEVRPSRLAWCYGDPGVAATLLYAARAVGVEEWARAALDIAVHAAGTAPEDSGVQDVGLCHGAFGLAHLYNRIYQASGDERFATAARLWYQQGLDMRRPERGIAGFESWEFGADGKLGWVSDRGLLTGAAGVGLALLAGLTSVEPQWDRLMMVAIPPRR